MSEVALAVSGIDPLKERAGKNAGKHQGVATDRVAQGVVQNSSTSQMNLTRVNTYTEATNDTAGPALSQGLA